MCLKEYYVFSQLFFYNELNMCCFGNFFNFYKYKSDSSIFFLKKGCLIFFYYYFFFCHFFGLKKYQYYLFQFFNTSFFYSMGHLKLEGRGYKLYLFLNQLVFKVGYSHLCYFLLPFSFFLFSKKKRSYYKLVGYSKDYLGNILSYLQAYRIPHIYKKKGIFIS
jgi:hypothetical protein